MTWSKRRARHPPSRGSRTSTDDDGGDRVARRRAKLFHATRSLGALLQERQATHDALVRRKREEDAFEAIRERVRTTSHVDAPNESHDGVYVDGVDEHFFFVSKSM